jgi:hypothetical protein|tara:strand:- start:2049 stop:2336 length:288 start_codon:yes stop_codon:yes gene_type:complete
MRKRQELTRGARFSNARAKALRKAKASKPVQGPKIKAMSTPTAQQAGEQLMDTFRKLPKVDNKAPISRQVIKDDDFNNTPRTYSPLTGSESYRPF